MPTERCSSLRRSRRRSSSSSSSSNADAVYSHCNDAMMAIVTRTAAAPRTLNAIIAIIYQDCKGPRSEYNGSKPALFLSPAAPTPKAPDPPHMVSISRRARMRLDQPPPHRSVGRNSYQSILFFRDFRVPQQLLRHRGCSPPKPRKNEGASGGHGLFGLKYNIASQRIEGT